MRGSSTTLSIILKLVDEASSAMQGVSASLKRTGDSMKSIGTSLTAEVTLPIVGVGYAATKAASDFQAAMTQLVTQAGLPADQLKNLTAQVQAFADSGAQQTPEVLAQGLYHIVSLGVPAAHAMDVLKLASEGAAIGHANLEDVANALGAAVASNIKGSGDYQQSMAILNATVGAGNMRMQDLAMSLGNVLPQATTAGLSLKDVGAAMATMTDNGMPAADAATRLHMAISLMMSPTGQAKKALESINVTQFQLADDMRNKGLLPALQDLHDHLVESGKTADQQAAVLSEAFGGGRSAGAIELLLNNLDRVGQKYQLIDEGVNKFGTDVAIQSQTASAQFAEAQAKMSDAMVKLGNAILPLVAEVLPKLVSAIVGLVNFFNRLPGPVKDGIMALLAIAAVVGPLLVVFGTLISSIGAIAGALGVAVGVLFWWVAVIAIAIAAVVAIAVVIYQHWGQIRDITLKVWSEISGFLVKLWGDIKSIFNTAVDALTDFLKSAWSLIKTIVKDAIDFIVGAIIVDLTALDPQWRQQWTAIREALQIVWDAMKLVVSVAIKLIHDYIVQPIETLWGWWKSIWQQVGDFFAQIWNGIKQTVTDVVNDILSLVDRLESAVGRITGKVIAPLKGIGNALSSAASAVDNAVSSITQTGAGATGLKVNDAIITPGGQVIQTDVADYIFATKNPGALAGGGAGTIVVNILGGNYLDSNGATMIANAIGKQIAQQIRLKNFN